MKDQVIKPVHLLTASAGTGKTYRLASEFQAAVSGHNHQTLMGRQPASPLSIVATTFTNQAASELLSRIRQRLMSAGLWADAQSVIAGRIGTVNSVCGRLISDFAIEAGISPSVNILAEERQREVFHTATESALSESEERLRPLLLRMGKDDWRNDVHHVVILARQNNISPAQLHASASGSWNSLFALLPEPLKGTERPDQQVRLAIGRAIAQFQPVRNCPQVTLDAMATLQEANRVEQAGGSLSWQMWAKLSKLKAGKHHQGLITPVNHAAQHHFKHPLLHEDLRHLIFGVFDCAVNCLELYAQFKRDRGLVDFIDQEQLVLNNLLSRPAVSKVLCSQIKTLLVDEFQDTSPLQLAIFLELARVASSSVWVGDEKQSIYSFRGADPQLMRSVLDKVVPISGGVRQELTTSYRSRPSIVSFVNRIFEPVASKLSAVGGDFIQNVARSESAAFSNAIRMWWAQGKSVDEANRSLVSGVLEMLSNRHKFYVLDKAAGVERALRGSDIALLCRTNECRLAMSKALSNAGILVETEKKGLLDTPECVLALAVLRYLSDPFDTLSIGEILRLTKPEDKEWLSRWLQKELRTARTRTH